MLNKKNTIVTPNIYIGLLLCLTIVCLLSIGPFLNFQSLVLFIMIPFLFVISLQSGINSKSLGNKEIKIFVVFVTLSLLTVFYSPNYEYFLTTLNGLIGALIISYIPIGLIRSNKNYELYFHLGFIFSILVLIFIEFTLGNFKLASFASELASRQRFFFNANYYSYISFFASFSLFYLHIKYRNILTLIALIIITLMMVILAFITQSRAGLLLILSLNVIFWLFIYKSYKKNVFQKILKAIIIICAFTFLTFKLIDIYSNSQIKNRVSSKDNSRSELIIDALNVFYENPIRGVGLGQFKRFSRIKQFSHNSYVESLAEHGLIGGILIIMLFVSPLLSSRKVIFKFKNNQVFKLNMLFFVSFLIYNNVYVFYKASFAMLYFFLVISIQNNLLVENNKHQTII